MPVSAARSAAACIYIQAHVASPHGILIVQKGIQRYTKVSVVLMPVFFFSSSTKMKGKPLIKSLPFQRDMKLNGILEFAVQRIVPLTYACFTGIYRASADTEFRAHFGLPHPVHIAVEYGEFQSG